MRLNRNFIFQRTNKRHSSSAKSAYVAVLVTSVASLLGSTPVLATVNSTTAQTQAGPVNPWATLRGPIHTSSGQAEVFGAYGLGCVSNAVTLATSTASWEIVTIERHRNFAHPELATYLHALARWTTDQAKFGKLVIADVAQPAGGPMSSHHVSHQSGLDTDIRFNFWPLGKKMPNDVRIGYPNPPVATHDVVVDRSAPLGYRLKSGLGRLWLDAYSKLLERAAEPSNVARIFVSAAIKKALCEKYRPQKADGNYPEWLRRIVPYYGHDEHFHVRLDCPRSSRECLPQAPIVIDTTDSTRVGCAGKNLEYWFDERGTPGSYFAERIQEIENPKPLPSQPRWVDQLDKVPQTCKDLLASEAHSH